MSEITVKDMCPHCNRETIVYRESEDGVLRFSGCQHCGKTLGVLPWQNRTWLITDYLKPRGE